MSRDSESVQFVAKSDFFMFLSFIIFLFFDIFNQILEKDAIFICALIRRTSYTMASFRSTLHKKNLGSTRKVETPEDYYLNHVFSCLKCIFFFK